MAKREISSTLKSLKFMQRAAQKGDKTMKEKEVMPLGDFPAPSAVKRCVVIVEDDPHPGATRGRMSFLNFNPCIDKLNKEESSPSETELGATSSGRQNEAMSKGENGSSQDMLDNSGLEDSSDDGSGHHKRKPAEAAAEQEYPKKSRKNDEDNQDPSPARSRSSKKVDKRGKLDWNVLRPPKHQSKKR